MDKELNQKSAINIKDDCKTYIINHEIIEEFKEIFKSIIKHKPIDIYQYISDYLKYGEAEALQDDESGLSIKRKQQIEFLYDYINQGEENDMTINKLMTYTNANSDNSVISALDIEKIFDSIKKNKEMNTITKKDFFLFFGHLSMKLDDISFNNLITEMSS